MPRSSKGTEIIPRLGDLPVTAQRSATALLPTLPSPDDSIRFLQRLLQKPEQAREIGENSAAFRYALTVSSYSRFLSEAVLRNPEWLLEAASAGNLNRALLREEFEALLEASIEGVPSTASLALFRRRQLLRLVLRDVLRFADLSEITEELSNLADAILHVTWTALRREMAEGNADARLSILALGKLGGKELNYSSDIDLMFVYSGEGHGPAEFFKRAVARLTEILSGYSAEGLCYRVDLRLRPDGRYGEVCQSLDGAKNYYATRGRDWELQMLIKARVSAGDAGPGRELLDFVEPLIYKTTTDFRAVEAVSETRARIHEKLRKGKQGGVDIKLARGGIRDIEFLVQCLQRLHGGREPWVRQGGTLMALSRLRDKELLSVSEYARLASAYQFLRALEHRLQFDEDRQTHTLPTDVEQLDLLARKMPSALADAAALRGDLEQHFRNVRNLYHRVIHAQTPVSPDDISPAPGDLARAEFPSINLSRYLDQQAPSFARLLASAGVARNQDGFESFIEKVVAQPNQLVLLDANEDLARCTIDVFEHSQYFSDQLIRHPELLEEVAQACGERQGRTGFLAPRDPIAMRRFFREQMVRIQSDSLYHRVPVFKTLKRTSDLAESVIAATYESAISGTKAHATAGYHPANQMMVVALGRLGMREFDLASDADLVFIIPDEDAAETPFWTRAAEQMISAASAYTGDGVIFTIDTRLRPNGREGALVQTESAYREYFTSHAQAWEGITYMKARAIAGDVDRATEFLTELQQVDWRRYGQGGRSRGELAKMRARLEREQGARNPLKAGPGGYYDIDFALMFLRLKSAGIFYKVLNTPERIDIVEKMGHLEREDAAFLREAATFYRALEHGLRISTGQAEGRLPTNRAQAAILRELVHRWTPPSLHDGTLEQVAKRIRQRTRAYFLKLFEG